MSDTDVMGDPIADKSPPLFGRIIRVGSAAAYLLVAVLLVWLAFARWNGVPADPTPIDLARMQLPVAPVAPELDRSQALAAALALLPPPPQVELPSPPKGTRWRPTSYAGQIDVGDALNGAWTPESRPNLRGVIQYLQDPILEQALSELAAVKPGVCAAGSANTGAFWNAVRLLTARARYRTVALRQIDAALEDLENAYRVSAALCGSNDGAYAITGSGTRARTHWELCQLAHENLLRTDQAARMIMVLHATQQASWIQIAANACDSLQRVLDRTYTDDGRGNGWLVLSHLDEIMPSRSSLEPRCGLWNILSPVFNDRRTVASKIDSLRELYTRIGGLPYNEAMREVQTLDTRQTFAVTDGPVFFASRASTVQLQYQMSVRDAGLLDAALASVALSAYRREHGEYPPTLTALLDGYLSALPNDPYIDRPLRYIRREDRQDYVLYSVGPDQIDDGGEHRQDTTAGQTRGGSDDIMYRRPRAAPQSEPQLEEAPP